MAQQTILATLVRTLIPFNVAAIIRGNSCSQQTEFNRANLTVGARDKNDHCETLPCSLYSFSLNCTERKNLRSRGMQICMCKKIQLHSRIKASSPCLSKPWYCSHDDTLLRITELRGSGSTDSSPFSAAYLYTYQSYDAEQL